MKYSNIFDKVYHASTSGDPEDRGEAYASEEDNIVELITEEFIEITPKGRHYSFYRERNFMAQNDEKDLFYVTVWGSKPRVGEGDYRRSIKVEGYSKKLPEKLLRMINEKGFKAHP